MKRSKYSDEQILAIVKEGEAGRKVADLCRTHGMDFMVDTLADGRTFRTLNIVDDFTRQCLAIEVDRSLPGARVVRVLERLRADIGLPQAIVTDNGPEFAGRTLDAWAYAAGVAIRFIRPGKPIENAYVESFNGKFRDECLNEHWFLNMVDAQIQIEAWRIDYNTVRPHSSLQNRTPDQFAQLSRGAWRLSLPRPDGRSATVWSHPPTVVRWRAGNDCPQIVADNYLTVRGPSRSVMTTF